MEYFYSNGKNVLICIFACLASWLQVSGQVSGCVSTSTSVSNPSCGGTSTISTTAGGKQYYTVPVTNGAYYTVAIGSNSGGGGAYTVSPATFTASSTTQIISVLEGGACTWTSGNTSASLTYTLPNPTTASVSTGTLSYCGTLTSGSLGGNSPSIGTGTWTKTSGPGTASFSNANSATSTATASAYGTYVYTWTIANGTCTSTATVTVNYYQTPTTASAGSTQNLCGTLTSTALGGNTPSVGTGAWSKTSGPGTVTFSNAASGSSTATATAYGTYVLTWTISNGTCTPSTANVTVNYYQTPTTASAGSTQNLCGTLTSTALGGNTPSVGTGAWSQTSGPGSTVFSNSASGSSTATATAYGTYVYTWTISNGTCTPSTASVTVNYYQTPAPTFTTVPSSPICNYTNATYTTQSGQSSYVWSGFGTLGVDYNIVSGSLGSGSNTVTLQWISTGTKSVTVGYSTNGCPGTSAPTSTVVNASPSPSLSSSGLQCTGSSITYTTQSGQSSYVWTIPGTSGTDYTLVSGGTSTSSTAQIEWITGGSKTVTVNYNNASGCTGVTAGSSTLSISVAPTSASLSDVIDPCNGGHTATVTVTGGTSPYTYTLTPSPGSASVYTEPSPFELNAGGASSYGISNITDANGCAPGSVTGNPVTYPARSLTSGGATESCTIAARASQIFYDASGNLMAEVTAGSSALGSTTVTTDAIDGSVQTTPTPHPQSYMQRHFHITPANNVPATVCLYVTNTEVSNLTTASAADAPYYPAFSITSNAAVTKIDGGSQTPASNTSAVLIPASSVTVSANPAVNGVTYSSTYQLCFPVSSFSGFYIGAGVGDNPLPVTLVFLTANAENNTYIQLDWATASETDNSGFDIERSTNGNDFTDIGWVPGHQNTNTLESYQYEDHSDEPDLTYYYRLKQVDVDGNFTYSPIVSAALTGVQGFAFTDLVPNPATDEVSVGVVSNVTTVAHVVMTDMLGRQVLNQDWPLTVGYNTSRIDLDAMAAGAYLVTVYAGNINTSKRLVVTK